MWRKLTYTAVITSIIQIQAANVQSQADVFKREISSGLVEIPDTLELENVVIPPNVHSLIIGRWGRSAPLHPTAYELVASQSKSPHAIRSADGRWWQIASASVHVRSTGAVGDGVADDTSALQRAIDEGRDVDLSGGLYRISGTLVIRTVAQSLTGSSIPRQHDGKSTGAGLLADQGLGVLLDVKAPDVTISSISFKSLSKEHISTGVAYSNSSGRADIDTRVENCVFFNLKTAVFLQGRGLNFTNNELSSVITGVELEWPAKDSAQEGVLQSAAGGFRSFRINNNRFHGVEFAVKNAGRNRANIASVHMVGNQFDIGGGLFSGVLRRSLIAANQIDQTYRPALELTDGSEDYMVVNNQIYGSKELRPKRNADYAIILSGRHKNGKISNNQIGYISKSPFLFSNLNADNFDITGNMVVEPVLDQPFIFATSTRATRMKIETPIDFVDRDVGGPDRHNVLIVK